MQIHELPKRTWMVSLKEDNLRTCPHTGDAKFCSVVRQGGPAKFVPLTRYQLSKAS